MELDSAFAPADSRVAAKVLDGELIIINLDTGYYYASTGTGVAIWQQIEGGASLREIVARLVCCYDVAEERSAQDARAFIEKLMVETLLVSSALAPGARATGATEQPVVRLPYSAPVLVKYDDMAEQFAMDPPLLARSRA